MRKFHNLQETRKQATIARRLRKLRPREYDTDKIKEMFEVPPMEVEVPARQ